MTYKSLGEAIRSARQQKRLTRAELARKIDVHTITVLRWEKGDALPERKHQRKLSEILELDPSIFVEAEKAAEKKTKQPYDHLWRVPLRNRFFTGRDDILSHLHTALASGTTTALTHVQTLCGLAGVGKTQIAVEYVYRFADDYTAVFWIRADPPGSLLADYTALAAFLDIPLPDKADQDALAGAVKRWLSEHPNWLLVLDNVENFGIVRDVLPAVRQGHVLLTTRAHDTGGFAQPIVIHTMSSEVGALLLLRRAGRPDCPSHDDREMAQRISDVMGGLPLALVQAGAYISATRCSLAGYLYRYKKHRAKLLGRPDAFNTEYPESVATTWSLSFENVEQASPAAADVLRLCAFLDAEAIPEEMIIDSARHLGPFLRGVTDEILLDDCMGTLLRYSFVQRDPVERTFSVHRLVQAVQMDSMKPETQHLWAERAMVAVNQALPYVEAGTETQQQGQRSIAHAHVACQSIQQQRFASLEAAQLLNKTGRYLREHAQYVQAESRCRESLRLYETLSGAPQEELAHCCTDLAIIAEWQGKRVEAEKFYEKACNLYEQRYGTDHAATATALNNKATFYLNQGQYTQATPLLKQALDIRVKTEGADSLDTANSRLSLAELYRQVGMHAEAEQHYKDVLALRERILGFDHLRVGKALSLLAGFYVQQDRLDEAEPLCRRAITIYEQRLGPEHHTITGSLMTLATIYKRQGKSSEAEALFNKTLHILEKTVGPEHPHLINALSILTRMCLEQDEAKANQFIERLLALAAQLRGIERAKVINDLILIGTDYLDRRQYEKARSFYARLLTFATQMVEPDDTLMVTLQIDLARACEYQGDSTAAQGGYLAALHRIDQQWGGIEHYPGALRLLQWYSSFLKRTRHDEEAALAETMMERIREISPHGNTEQ